MGKGVQPKPGLLPGKLVVQHLRSCQAKHGRCGLCFWGQRKKTWEAKLSSRWLFVTLKDKVARLGCSVCAQASTVTVGPWANFNVKPLSVKLAHLKRHERSKTHVAALAATRSSDHAALAPDASLFQDALQKMRAGGSARNGGGCSNKKEQVRWCLAESTMEVGRQVLREALCVALTRDERKGRLLIRWRACKPDLRPASGVLDFKPVEGYADNLAKAVKKAVQEYCQPRQFLPRGFVDGNPPASQGDVEANIKKKTSILVTDAAAPELLASGLLSGRRPYGESFAVETYLPALKVIQRDAAHASTRLLRRPFGASNDLSKLMDEFVSGHDAFAQKVWHSALYGAWWKELVQEETGGPTSLASAKHRFASFFLPLTRICSNMPQMVKLCHKVALVRGAAGDWAAQLLVNFSGRKAALLAMATDAAATCCELTRSLDAEDADISLLDSHVRQFAHSIQALFFSERVVELPTFTRDVCESLRKQSIPILHNGVAREVTITDEDVSYAYSVMKEWATLSLKTLEAEFPAWHLLTCFDVFQLAGTSARKRQGQGTEDALAKLSKVFEVDIQELKTQYVSVLPTAQAIQKTAGLENRQAWAEALTRLRATSALKKKYPAGALTQVVAAYVAFTASSSGCEQMFSGLKRSPAELASSRLDTDKRLAVVVGGDAQFDGMVVANARELYGSLLRSGRSRSTTRTPRMDRGRAGLERPDSHRAWLRKRKEAVDKAAQEEQDLCTPDRRPVLTLGENLRKEVKRQEELSKKRKAEAFLEGSLLDKEVTNEVRMAAEKKKNLDKANDKQRHKNCLRILQNVELTQKKQTPAWALRNLPQPALLTQTGNEKVILQRALKQAGVSTFVEDMRHAKLFVVDQVQTMTRSLRLLSAVMGCVVLSASILRGAGGVKLTFHAGLEQKVRLFLTEAFQRENAALTLVVREAIAQRVGWTAVTSEEARKKDGWKWGLTLKGKNENFGASRCKKILQLTGDEFVKWATENFVHSGASAWVKRP